MGAYKFSKTATEVKPDTPTTRLLEKAQDGQHLTRTEKDEIARVLYGVFGNHGSTYKLGGWAWPMAGFLKCILVEFTYEFGTYKAYYAPDKTSLRKVLGQVSCMVEKP